MQPHVSRNSVHPCRRLGASLPITLSSPRLAIRRVSARRRPKSSTPASLAESSRSCATRGRGHLGQALPMPRASVRRHRRGALVPMPRTGQGSHSRSARRFSPKETSRSALSQTVKATSASVTQPPRNHDRLPGRGRGGQAEHEPSVLSPVALLRPYQSREVDTKMPTSNEIGPISALLGSSTGVSCRRRYAAVHRGSPGR